MLRERATQFLVPLHIPFRCVPDRELEMGARMILSMVDNRDMVTMHGGGAICHTLCHLKNMPNSNLDGLKPNSKRNGNSSTHRGTGQRNASVCSKKGRAEYPRKFM